MRLSKRGLIVLALGIPVLIAALVVAVVVRPAAAANTGGHGSGAVTVTQASVDGVHWSTADTRTGGSSRFVPGPAPAPLGAGSVQMTTSSASAKAQLFSYGYIGTTLADLSALSYSDYRSSSSATSPDPRVSLNLEVYAFGTSGFTTFVFEPYFQSGGVGALHDNTWQTWDTLGSGLWWSTHTLTGVDDTITAHTQTWTWTKIVAEFPSAKIIGGLGFNVGTGWNGTFSGNADALVVGVSGTTTTYDFEPDTSICKNGGWQAYGFKNQGDCVSSVETGK